MFKYSTAQCVCLFLLSAWCIYRFHSCIVSPNLAWTPLHWHAVVVVPTMMMAASVLPIPSHQLHLRCSSSSSLNCNRISSWMIKWNYDIRTHSVYSLEFLYFCFPDPLVNRSNISRVQQRNRLWLFVLLAVLWHQRLLCYVTHYTLVTK
jgi:hypothetical protein